MIEQQVAGEIPVEHHDSVTACPEPIDRVAVHGKGFALLACYFEVGITEDRGVTSAAPELVMPSNIDSDQIYQVFDVAFGAGDYEARDRVIGGKDDRRLTIAGELKEPVSVGPNRRG